MHRCVFRLNEAEYKAFLAKLEKSKLSQQELARRSVLNVPVVCLEEIKPLVYELKKIGSNLNQVARASNAGTPAAAAEVEQIRKELQEVWQQLSLFLKRVQ